MPMLPGHVYIPETGDVTIGSQATIAQFEDESIRESEEGTIESGVGGSTRQIMNPVYSGVAGYFSNMWNSAINVAAQLHLGLDDALNVVSPATYSDLPIPQKPYEGPIAGAGPLGLFAPAPGSPEYEAYLARNREKVKKEDDEDKEEAEKPKWWEFNFDWSKLLPVEWNKAVREHLAAEEAKKAGGGLPVRTSEELKKTGAAVGEVGKNVAGGVDNLLDIPKNAGDAASWFEENKGAVYLGIGAFLLIMLLKR